jgi:hypothetical protein
LSFSDEKKDSYYTFDDFEASILTLVFSVTLFLQFKL